MNRGISASSSILASPLLATRPPVRRTATGLLDTADQDRFRTDRFLRSPCPGRDAHPRQEGCPRRRLATQFRACGTRYRGATESAWPLELVCRLRAAATRE